MANPRITINGQQYDSPEAMPPDVRRTYEEAMRAVGPSLASGRSGGTTQVFAGRAGELLGASVIVNRTITVNDRTYGSLDELPPDVRRQFEDALKGAAPKMRPSTSVHVSLNMGGPQVRTLVDANKPAPVPLAIEPSSLESRIRDIPVTLAILVIIGLALWALLGR